MPTLAELAGTKPSPVTDGISFVPTLLGEETVGRKQERYEYLYWEDPQSVAVRRGHWKAIRPKRKDFFELYDLSRDIEERNNVAAEHPDILKKMEQYAREASAPVRPGQVLDASLGFQGHNAD